MEKGNLTIIRLEQIHYNKYYNYIRQSFNQQQKYMGPVDNIANWFFQNYDYNNNIGNNENEVTIYIYGDIHTPTTIPVKPPHLSVEFKYYDITTGTNINTGRIHLIQNPDGSFYKDINNFNTNFGTKNNIISLEEKAYKTLPIHIKRHIMQNPEKFPEYSQVLLSKRIDILQSYKNKINLDPEEIKLMLTIIRIYNHIKQNPPKSENNYHELIAWDDFVKLYYPNFINLDSIPDDVDYGDYQDTWNKSFWLVYYTYLISYRKFYNLKNGIQENSVTLNFNRKKEKFSTFIYKQYKYLDENV
tara:strand:- start:305 stop:1207 length:903 start_codon:yes stop_codon:yes gene_type:complete